MIADVKRKYGIDKRTLVKLLQYRNRNFLPPHGYDSPGHCLFGTDYWSAHPEKNYDYTFNSWGFRGSDYKKFQNCVVNICIGDSFTMNIGDTIDHSWPSILATHLNEPTINLGINGLSFCEFPDIVAKAKQFFPKINKIFVLYNIFNTEQVAAAWYNNAPLLNVSVDKNIDLLKSKYWIPEAVWQFDPPWTFDPIDLVSLYKTFPNAHSYIKDIDIFQLCSQLDLDLLLTISELETKFNQIAGPSWPKYNSFCQSYINGIDPLDLFDNAIDKKLILEFQQHVLNPAVVRIAFANRDSWHMNKTCNQLIADYFASNKNNR